MAPQDTLLIVRVAEPSERGGPHSPSCRLLERFKDEAVTLLGVAALTYLLPPSKNVIDGILKATKEYDADILCLVTPPAKVCIRWSVDIDADFLK